MIKNIDTNFLMVSSLILLTIREVMKDDVIKTVAIIMEALIFTYPSL